MTDNLPPNGPCECEHLKFAHNADGCMHCGCENFTPKPVQEDPLHRWVRRLELMELVPLNGLMLQFSGSADNKRVALFKFDPGKAKPNARITPRFKHKGIEFKAEGYQKLDNGHLIVLYEVVNVERSRKWR